MRSGVELILDMFHKRNIYFEHKICHWTAFVSNSLSESFSVRVDLKSSGEDKGTYNQRTWNGDTPLLSVNPQNGHVWPWSRNIRIHGDSKRFGSWAVWEGGQTRRRKRTARTLKHGLNARQACHTDFSREVYKPCYALVKPAVLVPSRQDLRYSSRC
jgi:hypothetical protein